METVVVVMVAGALAIRRFRRTAARGIGLRCGNAKGPEKFGRVKFIPYIRFFNLYIIFL